MSVQQNSYHYRSSIVTKFRSWLLFDHLKGLNQTATLQVSMGVCGTSTTNVTHRSVIRSHLVFIDQARMHCATGPRSHGHLTATTLPQIHHTTGRIGPNEMHKGDKFIMYRRFRSLVRSRGRSSTQGRLPGPPGCTMQPMHRTCEGANIGCWPVESGQSGAAWQIDSIFVSAVSSPIRGKRGRI